MGRTLAVCPQVTAVARRRHWIFRRFRPLAVSGKQIRTSGKLKLSAGKVDFLVTAGAKRTT